MLSSRAIFAGLARGDLPFQCRLPRCRCLATLPDCLTSVVSLSITHPATGEEFPRKFQLENKFVDMYAGAVGYANDMDCLFRAAALLRQYPRIAFMIVGDGKELPSLPQQAES
jgi:hypothetical protein